MLLAHKKHVLFLVKNNYRYAKVTCVCVGLCIGREFCFVKK